VLAGEPALTPSQSESGDAGLGHNATRGGQTELLGLAVHLGPQAAGLHRRTSSLGIHTDALHRREVDHQPAVQDGVARHAVASATHRDGKTLVTRETQGGQHVRRPGAASDENRTPVDGGVPYPPRGVVPGVARLEQFAPEGPAKVPQHSLVQCST
jgi:hypothetical protein